MTLACARLGCTERAHTVLVFEPGSAAAWLMHAVEAHRTQGILLCRTHADVVTVPMGWNLVDERDPTWEPVAASPAPSPDPEPVATASGVPESPMDAEIVDIATVAPAEAAAPAVAEVTTDVVDDPAPEEDAEAAFEEVVAAQWTEPEETDDQVGTPTLFAVDDDPPGDVSSEAPAEDTSGSADTPLLNRAFRAAQRS
jgi:hypothetical protein